MNQRSTVRWQRLSIGAWLLLCSSVPALAQSPCDPSKPIEVDPWDRYQERDLDRCEGVYGSLPVSGDILGDIASFTLGKLQYQLDPTPLTVTWPSGVEGPVHLRAVALREDLLYQMDAVRPAGASSFEWPSDILRYRKIEPADLGIRAWVVTKLLNQPRALHVPIGVRQGDLVYEPDRYWLVVMPGAPLRKLEVALDRLNTEEMAGGQSAEASAKLEEITPYRDLGQEYYAARRAVRIGWPIPSNPGKYRLRLRAERDGDGEPDSESFWFVHVAS